MGELALLLVCPVVTWAKGEMSHPFHFATYNKQVGEQVWGEGSSEWESWPCSSPTVAPGRMGIAYHLGSIALDVGVSGELYLKV